MPAPSVTKFKLTDATVVAVTATVPVALVAEAGTPTNAMQATSTTIENSFLINFSLSWISWKYVPYLSQHSSKARSPVLPWGTSHTTRWIWPSPATCFPSTRYSSMEVEETFTCCSALHFVYPNETAGQAPNRLKL